MPEQWPDPDDALDPDDVGGSTAVLDRGAGQIDMEAMFDEVEDAEDDGQYEKRTLGVFFWVAVTWLVLLLLASVFADLLPLKDPTRSFRGASRVSPNGDFWFGGDNIGRDVFSRTIYGARKSIGVSLIATVIAFFIGGTIGMLAGYYRGRLEGTLTGGVDILLAFPALILALILVIFLGQTEIPVLRVIAGSETKAVIIALGILSIPTISRITRAGVLVNSNKEFVLASRTLGARDLRIMVREILPNVLPAMVAFALIGLSFLIIVEASLAFLGVGDVKQPSWGIQINLGRSELDDSPHMVFFPALFMFLTILSINYVGDRLRAVSQVKEAAL